MAESKLTAGLTGAAKERASSAGPGAREDGEDGAALGIGPAVLGVLLGTGFSMAAVYSAFEAGGLPGSVAGVYGGGLGAFCGLACAFAGAGYHWLELSRRSAADQ